MLGAGGALALWGLVAAGWLIFGSGMAPVRTGGGKTPAYSGLVEGGNGGVFGLPVARNPKNAGFPGAGKLNERPEFLPNVSSLRSYTAS